MSETYCIAKMRFVDVTAIDDATMGSTSYLGDLELLKEDKNRTTYGTLELNQFVLNGSKNMLPNDAADIPYWCTDISDSNCNLSDIPTLEISFEESHSCAGITFLFAEEYPTALRITWYSLGGSKLMSKEFTPDDISYTCKEQVENFGKVVIEFLTTQYPGKCVKLNHILYGLEIEWKKDMIQSAKVQEEVDLTCGTLSVNTADISIVDEANDFDIGNENGAWKSVQRTQEVTLTEYKDGHLIPAGTYYIDKPSFNDNVAKFTMIDAIGLMDQYTFYDGAVYENVKAGVILEAIFSSAGITKYSISDDVYNILLSGYLKIQKSRAALQQVCFACGALAEDSRSDTIRVYKPDRYVKYTVGTDRKFSGKSKVALDEYISGVSIEYSKYIMASAVTKLYDGVLQAGDNKITFSYPVSPSSITATSGMIKSVSTNYMVINMTEAGACTITGKKYEESKFIHQKDIEHLPAGEVECVKKFSSITLYNADVLEENAERLLNYYSLRKNVNMSYLIDLEQVGNWVNIRDVKGQVATSLIEKQTLDLTGGFIAQASCRGYSVVVTENYYTGTELYSGGGGIL